MLGLVASLASFAGCGSGTHGSGATGEDARAGTDADLNATVTDGGAPDVANATMGDGPDVDSGPTTIPLTGCPSMGYAADFTIDAQKFQLVIDTGSSNLAVAASTCTSCKVTPEYVPGASAVDAHAQINASFGIGSWTGEAYDDRVTLDALGLSVPMRFTAIQTQNQFFTTQGCSLGTAPFAPQGVAGLGPADLAATPTAAFMTQAAQSGAIPNVVAVELCSLGGGQMWLGGYDAKAAAVSGPVVYTPISATGYYRVTLSDAQIAGSSLGYGPADFGRTLVDTGSSSLGLPPPAFTAFTVAIQNNAAFTSAFPMAPSGWLMGNQCFPSTLTRAQLDAQLPVLALVLPDVTGGSITVSLKPSESYLTPSNVNGTMYYCSGVIESTQTPTTTLIGAAAMSGHLVVFDGANNRIGFATQTYCE